MKSLQDKINTSGIDCNKKFYAEQNISNDSGLFMRWYLNFQHTKNPMHVYCRKVENGVPKEKALRQAVMYEKIVYNPTHFALEGIRKLNNFAQQLSIKYSYIMNSLM